MRGGDLSNRITPRIFIRMNETLFEETPVDNMFNKLKSKLGLTLTTEYHIRKEALSFIDRLVTKCNYNVHLVFINGEDKEYDKKFNVIDKELLFGLNVIKYSTMEFVDRYLDTCNTFLVDTNCYRNNVYTLEEAVLIFR